MRVTILVLSLLLSGCSAVLSPGAPVAALDAPAATGRAIVVTPEIEADGYHTLAQVVPYVSGDINHLVVQLFTLSGNPEVETAVKDAGNNDVKADILAADLGKSVTFGNLRPNTTYRIRAFAYKATGTAAGDLISTTDANSYVDLAVTDNDAPMLATLKVRLADKDFSGQASSSGITVTDGGLRPVANETISQ